MILRSGWLGKLFLGLDWPVLVMVRDIVGIKCRDVGMSGSVSWEASSILPQSEQDLVLLYIH